MAKDFIEPGYRDGDGAISEFDQLHAIALGKLRKAKSFFLVVRDDNEEGSGIYHLSAIQNEDEGGASAFLLSAAMEASRLFTHSMEEEKGE